MKSYGRETPTFFSGVLGAEPKAVFDDPTRLRYDRSGWKRTPGIVAPLCWPSVRASVGARRVRAREVGRRGAASLCTGTPAKRLSWAILGRAMTC